MRVTFDAEVDAAYVYFTAPQEVPDVARTYSCDPVDVDGVINLDFDVEGRLVGVEVLAATSKLPPYVLERADRPGWRGTEGLE